MSLNREIKKLCDESLNELFSHTYWLKIKNKKAIKGNTDPLYSDVDGRMAFIIHSVTIRSGVILEKLYFEAIKICCPNLRVWNERKFKISKHAMSLASDQDNKDVLTTDLPYGEAHLIGKKRKKTRQIDLFTYDKDKEILNCYEIKRGGGHHDSEKQEKIIENLIAVRMLLKRYGEDCMKLKIKKYKSFIISHMNQELFSPDYRYLQINGNEVNKHFNANILEKINEGYDYYVGEFKRRFNKVKKESYEELANKF
tara:strand:+ start:117 stop:881 length:765 start_codon:yes stop_codon:yes gene_type:complete